MKWVMLRKSKTHLLFEQKKLKIYKTGNQYHQIKRYSVTFTSSHSANYVDGNTQNRKFKII